MLHRRLVALDLYVTQAHGFGELAVVVDQRGQGAGGPRSAARFVVRC
ncbi:MAG: hypothetical protein M3305_17555 [Actinomycetota bacterium]|nr:hypothetical protein [Actinomycetota bacterium]